MPPPEKHARAWARGVAAAAAVLLAVLLLAVLLLAVLLLLRTGGRSKGSSGVAMWCAESAVTSSISNDLSGSSPACARCLTSTTRGLREGGGGGGGQH